VEGEAGFGEPVAHFFPVTKSIGFGEPLAFVVRKTSTVYSHATDSQFSSGHGDGEDGTALGDTQAAAMFGALTGVKVKRVKYLWDATVFALAADGLALASGFYEGGKTGLKVVGGHRSEWDG